MSRLLGVGLQSEGATVRIPGHPLRTLVLRALPQGRLPRAPRVSHLPRQATHAAAVPTALSVSAVCPASHRDAGVAPGESVSRTPVQGKPRLRSTPHRAGAGSGGHRAAGLFAAFVYIPAALRDVCRVFRLSAIFNRGGPSADESRSWFSHALC